ncbi:MAG: calcium/sodium antiporter [Cytophagales bacterium]|nr:calcium/sodium antiporter [Cytophagales bacterium]
MDAYITYTLFIVGFVLLIKGADYLVEGACSIAKQRNIPELVIGLTIISFGTSLPELIVNLLSSGGGNADIAIGNIFGSNVANILLILGATAFFAAIPIRKSIYFTEIPISLVATLLVAFLANANLFHKPTVGEPALSLSQYDGIILLVFFFLFMSYIYVISRYKNDDEKGDVEEDESEQIEVFPTWKSLLFILGGGVGLFFGGKWVVEGAINIAANFGMSQKLIGLTVVAIGTSLPELVTSITAARKGLVNMAVGNAIGSNVFNLLWILGLSAVIKPLPFQEINNTDILMIVFGSTLLFFTVIIGKKPGISKGHGILFILIYAAYLAFLVHRG